MNSTSNSSGSRCSGRAYLPSNSAPLYQVPEPVFTKPPLGSTNANYEPRSSIGDNMTYSEVNSTAYVGDADNEQEDVETDFDSYSCSAYGQASASDRFNFSQPLTRNHPPGVKANHHHSPAPKSPKLVA